MAGRSQGKKVLDRILIEGDWVCASSLDEEEEQWIWRNYLKMGAEDSEYGRAQWCGELKTDTAERPDKAVKRKRRIHRKPRINLRVNVHSHLGDWQIWGKAAVLLGMIGWILSRFWIFASGIPGGLVLYLNVDNNVLVFAVQMAAAWTAVSIRDDLRKRKFAKGEKNNECSVSDSASGHGSGSSHGETVEKGRTD